MPPTSPSQSAVAKKTQDYDNWEVPDAMRTLQRADEIQQNPSLHKAVKRHARKQLRGLKKIAAAKPSPPMSATKR